MDIINRHGLSIYLKITSDALFERLVSRKYKRPLIRDLTDTELKAFINKKLDEREPWYNKSMHIVEGFNLDYNELENLVMD